MIEERITLSKGQVLVKIADEHFIDWETQNQIHILLNSTFGKKKSKSFINKTFARVEPEARVLLYMDNALIGHMGISSDRLLVDGEYIGVGCLGLWCVDNIRDYTFKQEIATNILLKSMNYLNKKKYTLGIGVTNSKAIENKILPNIKSSVISVPLYGENTKSKDNDKFLLFNCGVTDVFFSDVENKIIKQGFVRVGKEVF